MARARPGRPSTLPASLPCPVLRFPSSHPQSQPQPQPPNCRQQAPEEGNSPFYFLLSCGAAVWGSQLQAWEFERTLGARGPSPAGGFGFRIPCTQLFSSGVSKRQPRLQLSHVSWQHTLNPACSECCPLGQALLGSECFGCGNTAWCTYHVLRESGAGGH